jgi:hypothetical protein
MSKSVESSSDDISENGDLLIRCTVPLMTAIAVKMVDRVTVDRWIPTPSRSGRVLNGATFQLLNLSTRAVLLGAYDGHPDGTEGQPVQSRRMEGPQARLDFRRHSSTSSSAG